jgi:hypothetical protein
MNLTPREQEILDEITSPYLINGEIVGVFSETALARLLARMEGSKEGYVAPESHMTSIWDKEAEKHFTPKSEEKCDGCWLERVSGKEKNAVFHSSCDKRPTPPSEEKKCKLCTHEDPNDPLCEHTCHSPTPPDALIVMDEKSSVDWDKIAPPDAWEELLNVVDGFADEWMEESQRYLNRDFRMGYNRAMAHLKTRLKEMRTK